MNPQRWRKHRMPELAQQPVRMSDHDLAVGAGRRGLIDLLDTLPPPTPPEPVAPKRRRIAIEGAGQLTFDGMETQ